MFAKKKPFFFLAKSPLCYNKSGDIMITMRNIILEGHPTLNKVANSVKTPLTFADRRLARDLHQFVVNSQDEQISTQYLLRPAVGIAAPQINISKRMFAVHFSFKDEFYSFVVVNPKIINRSEQTTYLPGGEGCLSVDYDVDGLTPRAMEIDLEFEKFDPETNKLAPASLKLKGYPAIVFQHEIDHLDGILFTSKVFDELPDAIPAFEIITE